MKKLSGLMLVSLLLFSCTSNLKKESYERRNVEEYFQSSGVVKYFLPDLPDWANRSSTAGCMRKSPVRYFNFKNLMESFALDYEMAVQFQYMFNIESRKLKKEVGVDYLPLKDEERTFYLVSERIQAGIFEFIAPKFKRIHLIWIDPAINDEKELKQLKSLMSQSQMDLGHPVFVSLCLDQIEMAEFVQKNKFRGGIRFIPHVMFSPYNREKELGPRLYLNVDAFFKPNQKLYLYLPKKYEGLKEIKGNYKPVKY